MRWELPEQIQQGAGRCGLIRLDAFRHQPNDGSHQHLQLGQLPGLAVDGAHQDFSIYAFGHISSFFTKDYSAAPRVVYMSCLAFIQVLEQNPISGSK